MKSNQAQAAAQIRKHLKGMGLKCSVTSDSGSMTSSVNVQIYNQPPAIKKKVEEFSNKYQYGHFDGMTDTYEYSNGDDAVPQAKYVFVSNKIDDELTQKAWEFIRPIYADADKLPEKYKEVGATDQIFGEWATSIVYRFLIGSFDEKNSQKFWATITTGTLTASDVTIMNNTVIEEHTHTKKGFQMFICIMPDRVERSEYLELLSKAKSLGGWYSRKWGKTPAGFAFKEKTQANEFATDKPVQAPRTPPVAKKIEHSAKIRKLADGLQNQIDNKFADRQTNTPKRLAQARHATLEGEKLQRTQTVLNGLADMHEAGTLPDILSKFTSKKSVYDLMGSKKTPVSNGYHQYYSCTGAPYHDTAETLALWGLLTGKTDEEKKAEELQRKIDGLQFAKIPGYFPTPGDVIDKMIEYANIQKTDTVLDPELGSGAIADRVAPLCAEVGGYEINLTLASICEAKGYLYRSGDFLEVDVMHATDSKSRVDKILMNPPFENKQDIKHIRHAMNFLKPGGVLVAICANGPNQQRELMPIADHWEELPQGTFKGSGTGVSTALMVMHN